MTKEKTNEIIEAYFDAISDICHEKFDKYCFIVKTGTFQGQLLFSCSGSLYDRIHIAMEILEDAFKTSKENGTENLTFAHAKAMFEQKIKKYEAPKEEPEEKSENDSKPDSDEDETNIKNLFEKLFKNLLEE